MLEKIYLFYILFGYAFLFIGIYLSQRKDAESRRSPFGAIFFLLLATITFFMLKTASFNFEVVTCTTDLIGERCDLVIDGTEEIYKYGNNYSGYHWDYSSPSPSVNDANLFHKYTNHNFSTICYNTTTADTSACTTEQLILEDQARLFLIMGILCSFIFVAISGIMIYEVFE